MLVAVEIGDKKMYIVTVNRNRFQVIHDGGTHRSASIYDGEGRTDREKIISISDLDVVPRPLLERYVHCLNEEYVEYLISCAEFLNEWKN